MTVVLGNANVKFHIKF